MKSFKIKILLLLTVLSACSVDNCKTDSFNSLFHYGDQIIVTKGFYIGSNGTIISQFWKYSEGCYLPAFKVNIYNNNVQVWEEVIIEQNDLEKK